MCIFFDRLSSDGFDASDWSLGLNTPRGRAGLRYRSNCRPADSPVLDGDVVCRVRRNPALQTPLCVREPAGARVKSSDQFHVESVVGGGTRRDLPSRLPSVMGRAHHANNDSTLPLYGC